MRYGKVRPRGDRYMADIYVDGSRLQRTFPTEELATKWLRAMRSRKVTWSLPVDREQRSVIYFIGEKPLGEHPIKIGVCGSASEIRLRLGQLQVGHPSKLHVHALLVGSVRMERWLHLSFAEDRLVGEWFRPTPRLLELIEAVGESHAPELEKARIVAP